MNFKKIALVLILLCICAAASFAIKVRELPFASEIHIGLCTGSGAGINIGFSAGWHVSDITFGTEIEQVFTDVGHSANIGGTRVGASIKAPLLYESFSVGLHLGIFECQATGGNISYNSDGNSYILNAGERYRGQYQALSFYYDLAEYIISSKFYLNMIDGQGKVTSIDFNIGRTF